VRYLAIKEIVELHDRLIARFGGARGIRDQAALESSVAQPFQTFEQQELYGSFLDKVTTLAFLLIRNHPFVDGNKRVGHAALEVSLALNGVEIGASIDEQEDVVISVASGSLSREDFAEWVNGNIVAAGSVTPRDAPDAIRDFPLIRARMTRERAAYIRQLRVAQSYSWRMVAAECHESWAADASWDPPSNQLAGMELCEAAAEFFNEHFLQTPWN
jgi:death on curing protein